VSTTIKTVWTGKRVIFGIPKEIKPIFDAPFGKQRLRFRAKSTGRLFVKTPEGIRHFVLVDDGDVWRVDYDLEQGRNVRL
jgi:hypothetical protein